MTENVHTKIDRLVHRDRAVQKALQKEVILGKDKYYLMEITIDKVKSVIEHFEEENVKHPISLLQLIKVREYDSEDPADNELFTTLFNLVLMTSPDPYRPLTVSDANKYFKEGTFLAFLYGQCVGYGVLTIENTEIGKIGVIAGIGVHPKHRRKKIALKIALEMGKWFLQRSDLIALQCEVYHENITSQKFISSFGFRIVGEIFLD